MIRHCTVLVPRFKSIFRIGERKGEKKNVYPPTRLRHCAKPMVDARRARQECDRERGDGGGGRRCRIARQPLAVNPPFPSLLCGCAPQMSVYKSLRPRRCLPRWLLSSENLLLLSPPTSAPDTAASQTRQSIGSLLLQASLSSENHPAFPIFFFVLFVVCTTSYFASRQRHFSDAL